ncbi:MAG: hypothetical protein EOP62_00340 [Sphingomonadales bacterium]|nr:MAG: hypothetical protein EOP62_00340 [Sphingomonadales bacterium]
MAVVMALTMVAGFSLQFVMGRSSFGAPLLIHLHAVVFFGWVVLYLLQNVFVYRGVMGLHRTLGWIGAVWMAVMVVVGIYTTMTMVRRGAAPFFFEPSFFLVMNALIVIGFAGLTSAAILLRKRTDWHRRLHYCGMAMLTAPAFGRLLPAPLMIPWAGWGIFAATMIWPVIGIIADLRRTGRVHDSWWWGVATMVLVQCAMSAIAYSDAGVALYDAVTAGYPGAAVPPLDFAPPPPMP